MGREDSFTSLAEGYGVKPQFISDLVKGGVEAEDIEDVLGLRRDFCALRGDEEVKFGPGAAVLAEAYRAVEGDLDQLSELVEKAEEILSDEAKGWEKGFKGRYSRALKIAMERHISAGGVVVDDGMGEDRYDE